MEEKRALITGITGQDGSYLAELLLEKGYVVYGILRRSSSFNTGRLNHIFQDPHEPNLKLIIYYGDLTDSSSINDIIRKTKFDEIYNLGAQSHVRVSFDIPENTAEVTALGTLRVLEAMRRFCPEAKFYQASSSEMFGNVTEIPQDEKTSFNPMSPYGCSKVFSFNITKNYREAYNLFACNGILFNHESERRGETFVTRKITKALARAKFGLQEKLWLGNLEAKRDWGHAKDYVEAMWLMLQHEEPDDYVIGTGETHSVREFLEEAAKCIGLEISSNGKKGGDEKYVDKNGKVIVEIDSHYFRPSEVNILQSNPLKAKTKLGWEPKIKFKELVRLMVNKDLKDAEDEFYLKNRK